MLYIELIDQYNVRLRNAANTYSKVYAADILRSHKDELGRVYIENTATGDYVLQHGLLSDITLDGQVYSNAVLFVMAFNNLVTTGSTGSAAAAVYNTPGAGTVTNDTITFEAGTLHSLTIVCIVGSADITVGEDTVTMDAGQSLTWEASGLLDKDITIDTTGGANYSADYITMVVTPATTTTTTEAPATTTTTEAATTTTTSE